MRRLRVLATFTLLAVGTSTGCFVLADMGRFHPVADQESLDGAPDAAGDANVNGDPDGALSDDPTKPNSLVLTLQAMGYHLQQLIEASVIDASNRRQSRIYIQPLNQAGTQTITVHVPNAIPPTGGPYRLDLYADMNSSGDYDGIGGVLTEDHAWRVASPLVDTPPNTFPHVPNVTQIVFLHSTQFTDIYEWPLGTKNPPKDTALNARIAVNAASLAPYVGRLLQVRIEETRTKHTVGLYRIPEIPAEDFVARMDGVLDVGADYFVTIYVDANGNGVYDNPATVSSSSDLGWSIPVRSTNGAADGGVTAGGPYGIDMEFNLLTTPFPNNVDVGAP